MDAMGKVVAITNQKGGVGKTTTAINLAASLAIDGKRVLMIDMDPQGNASSGLGVSGDSVERGIYEVLVEDLPIQDALAPTGIERLDLVPSGQRLSGAEIELVGLIARESRLRQSIQPVRAEYDYILVDCPPSLGLLTLNTLTAADSVLVPLQCEYYALEGLSHLLQAIRLVQQRLNPGLHMEGVLLTMYDHRLNLCQQVEEEARKYFADRVYRTVIPRNVRLSEAPSFGKPAVIYDPSCVGAASYRSLAREVIGSA